MQRSNVMVAQDHPYASFSTSSAGAMQPPPRVTGLGLGLAVSATAFLLVVATGIASYYCTRMREEDDATAARGVAAAAAGVGGIDEATLMRWPKVVYSEAGACGGQENGCCAVCLAEYGDGDVLQQLPECGHLFHVECVDPWLRSHSSCPICRSSPEKPATMKPAPPSREVVLSIES